MEKMVTKISIKEVVGVVGKILQGKKEGERVDLMRIVGICSETKNVPTAYGDSTKLRGQFKATNKETGDVFMSTSCYLPDAATDLISCAFSADTKAVQFAFDIGAEVKAKKDGTLGYVYTVTPLTKPEENNPLALLEQKIQ